MPKPLLGQSLPLPALLRKRRPPTRPVEWPHELAENRNWRANGNSTEVTVMIPGKSFSRPAAIPAAKAEAAAAGVALVARAAPVAKAGPVVLAVVKVDRSAVDMGVADKAAIRRTTATA